MDELPLAPIAAAAILLFAPARRRIKAMASAAAPAGAVVVVASARGVGDIASAALYGGAKSPAADAT